MDLTDLVQIILKYSAKVWCCLNNLFLPCRGCAAPPSPLPSKYLKSEDKLRTFQNFNQISKCQCIADISKCKHLKGRFEGTCPFITLSLSGPEVGLLLRSFALKGNNDLIWAHMRRPCSIMIKLANLKAQRHECS